MMMAAEGITFPGSIDSESVRKNPVRYHPPIGRVLIAEADGDAGASPFRRRTPDTGRP